MSTNDYIIAESKRKNAIVAFMSFIMISLFLISTFRLLYIYIYYSLNNSNKITSRGNILDANDNMLAFDVPRYWLYINKDTIKDINNENIDELIDHIFMQLTNIFPNYDTNKLSRKKIKEGKFIWVKKNMSPYEYKLYRSSGGALGVGVIKNYSRFYPYDYLTSSFLGVTNVYNNGINGIEYIYNDVLKNTNKPLKLTLDVNIQAIVANEIINGFDKYNPDYAMAIIADIKNSNIVSIYKHPSESPNTFIESILKDDRRFSMYTNQKYELGSIMKVFTIAHAIEKGLNLSKKYYIDEKFKIGNYMITDFIKYNRFMDINEIFEQSSNIGIAKIVNDYIDPVEFKEFYKSLGFDDMLTMYLDNSQSAFNKPIKWNKQIAQTVGYGYSIATTPIHVLQAFVGILNDGMLSPLRILKDDTNISNENLNEKHRIISSNTSKLIKKLLISTVKNGTANQAHMKNIQVGGKTGTSKIYINGKYSDKKVIASFLCAFPMNDPKYAMIVIFYNPSKPSRPSGGSVSVPVAKNIISRLGVII